MRQTICLGTILLLCLVSFDGSAGQSDYVLQVGWGSAPGQVGLYNPPDDAPMGPGSFYVGEDGTIYVVDTVNNRINRYKDNRFLGSTSLNEEQPTDLLVYKNSYYVTTIFSVSKVTKSGEDEKTIWVDKFTSKQADQVDNIYRFGDSIVLSATGDSGEVAYCTDPNLHKVTRCKGELQELVKDYTLQDANGSFYAWSKDGGYFGITDIRTGKVLKKKETPIFAPDKIYDPKVLMRFSRSYIYLMGANKAGYYIERIPYNK